MENALALIKVIQIHFNMKFKKVAYINIQITLVGKHTLFPF